MATGRINVTEIRAAILRNRGLDEYAVSLIQDRFEVSKEKMLDQFDRHVVTEEILEGPQGDNISGTLSRAKVPGNLCAFLGFVDGSEEEEIADLHSLIDQSVRLNTIPVKSSGGNFITYRFTARIPTQEEIYKNTPVQWGETSGNRSWVAIVEEGTDTFSYYLYKHWVNGRSKEGIQAKTKDGQLIVVNQGSFKPTPYTKEILKNFVESVGSTDFYHAFGE